MSLFMKELLDVAKDIIPEADIAETENNIIRLSWKTNDDPDRPNKRFQPVIIEIHDDFLSPLRTSSGKLPENISPEIRKEFTSFVRNKRTQFKPRTTKNNQEPHAPDRWVFFPE